MASFTDKIPSFNPYVQQLPVEAMAQVGMEKQQRYDQGIQKIQSSIDNVAGMDIARDVDKQYLQSKLDQLGTNLRTVAAGDFSNFQLTNSVAGMASRIAKDSVVQNAVYSTKVMRKGQEELEQAKKDGKSSIQNEEWWNKDVNTWLNDKNLNTKFGSSYIEYTDVDKKLRDIADKLHETESSIDNPFKRDAQGNTLVDEKGRPVVDDAMLRISTKSKPAEKILANFYDSLTENDLRQLKIDGWYHYKGANKETFKADAVANYDAAKKLTSDSISNMTLEMQTNTKLSEVEKSDLQARINATSAKLKDGSLEVALQKQLSGLDNTNNLDDYKYKLYTQKHLTTLAKDLSEESYKQEIVNNPYKQMDMEKQRLQFSYDNANREQDNWERNFSWSQTKFKMTQKLKEGGTPVVLPDRISTSVDTPSLATLNKDIVSISGMHKEGNTEVMGAIDELNAKYAPVIPELKNLDTSEAKRAYLNNLASKYSQDPSFITTQTNLETKEYLKQRRAYDILLAQKQTLYDEAVKESAPFTDKMNKILTTEPGVSLPNGFTLYTARELYDLPNSASRFMKTVSLGGQSVTGAATSTTIFDAKGFLDQYVGTKNEAMARAWVKNYYNEPMNPLEKEIINKSKDISSKYYNQLSNINEERAAFQSKYLADRMPERQTMTGTLSSDNKNDMHKVQQLIIRKNKEYSNGGVDSEKRKDFDPDVALKLQGTKNVGYAIIKKYDGSADLVISAGTASQTLPMNSEEFRGFFPEYTRSNPVSEIKYNILASSNKTTNLKGVSDGSAAVNAGLTGDDIPQLAGTALAPLVRLDVNGSAFNNGSTGDKYQVVLYVNDNGTWYPETLNTEGYVGDAGLDAIIKNIGTQTVESVLNKHKKK